ncbi:MAG: ABC transporter ATP-binding protein [Bacillota bacterium]|nr:ABC transporter ATP-binding protein [Bacillota bacterium]
MHAIETTRLTKYYGKNRGIIDVDLQVDKGEIFGFIGPNGAGKTTTIRILLGLLRPSSGQARLFGKAVPTGGGNLYRNIGYVPAEVSYYPEMTGRDLLNYAAGFYDLDSTGRVEELAERLQFEPNHNMRTYSHGNLKKLCIIQALMHRPQLVILDEPGSGLDPLVRQELFDILEEMNQEGATIFFSTHVLEEIERICHRVAMIKEGRLLQVGPVDKLPGRDMHVVTMKIAGSQPSKVDLAKIGEAEEMLAKPGYYRVLSRLPINMLVDYLNHLKLEYLRITDPSLEEIFMELYEPAAKRGNSHNV